MLVAGWQLWYQAFWKLIHDITKVRMRTINTVYTVNSGYQESSHANTPPFKESSNLPIRASSPVRILGHSLWLKY